MRYFYWSFFLRVSKHTLRPKAWPEGGGGIKDEQVLKQGSSVALLSEQTGNFNKESNGNPRTEKVYEMKVILSGFNRRL